MSRWVREGCDEGEEGGWMGCGEVMRERWAGVRGGWIKGV